MRHPNHANLALGLITGVALLVASASPADATLARRLTMEDLCASADAIVRVTVDSKESTFDPLTKRIWTTYTCTIAESLHGNCDKTQPLVIHTLGGIADGIQQVVAGEPVFEAKKAYSVFLRQEKKAPRWRVAGMNQGRFAEAHDAKTNATSVANSYAGLTLVEIKDGGAVKLRVQPKALSYKLDDFRAEVRNTLQLLAQKAASGDDE